MKDIKFLWVAAAVLVASCANPQTRITGSVAEGIDSVYVRLDAPAGVEAVPVENGQFVYNGPVNPVSVGILAVGDSKRPFLLDGSQLTVTLQEDGTYAYNVDNPESANVLVAEFYSDMLVKVKELNAAIQTWYQNGQDRESEEFNQLMEAQDKFYAEAHQWIESHLDSPAVLPALSDFGGYEDEEMSALIAKMDPALHENVQIKSFLERQKAVEATREGKMFVDFTIPDSDGKEVKLSDYVGKGKYVLVDFWASWCGPCRGEIPNLIEVYNKYKGDNFDVLGVAVWDKPEDSKAAAEKLGISYNEIINAQQIPTDAYGIAGIPQIILFGPDGTILKRDLRGEGIEAEVAKYVQPAK